MAHIQAQEKHQELHTEPQKLAFTSLRLMNFRNYDDLQLNFDGEPVAFYGKNGAGKTNILEALSLFSPGKGLRNAKAIDICNTENQTPTWGVHVTLDKNDEKRTLATGTAPTNPQRRTLQIDGKNIKSQVDLGHTLSLFWLTPSMDRLLSGETLERRKFFDRLAYHLNPAHGENLTALEKTVKERSVLLKEDYYDPSWVSVLEERIIDLSLKIYEERTKFLTLLQGHTPLWTNHFPYPKTVPEGRLETALKDGTNLLNKKDFLLKEMVRLRDVDRHVGGAKLGAHKTDFVAFFQTPLKKAHFCSTGEQKALLIGLILGYIESFIGLKHVRPLLLLDEMVAHLDPNRRAALLEVVTHLGVQTFMTGTERMLFDGLKTNAQFFYVNEAKVKQEL